MTRGWGRQQGPYGSSVLACVSQGLFLVVPSVECVRLLRPPSHAVQPILSHLVLCAKETLYNPLLGRALGCLWIVTEKIPSELFHSAQGCCVFVFLLVQSFGLGEMRVILGRNKTCHSQWVRALRMSQKQAHVLCPLQFLLFLSYFQKGFVLNLLRAGEDEEEVSRVLIGSLACVQF